MPERRAEMRSQGMQPSVRDRDLVTFCHRPIFGLGTVRSQTMRRLADLSHTLSTNCCQPAEGICWDGAVNEF